MLTQKFWNYGFRIHLGIVLLISISAYLGILPTTPKGILRYDLLGHLVLIGVLAFFLDGVLHFRPFIPGRFQYIRLAPVIILALAAVEEFAQRFSLRRTSSLADLFADAIGIVLFSWLAKYVARRYGPEVKIVTHPSPLPGRGKCENL